MEAVTKEDFLHWAASVNIGFDPRYPDSGCLSLLPPCRHSRFWVRPVYAYNTPRFAATLLKGLDEWNTGYLWPRSGRWPDPKQSQSYRDDVLNAILRGAGIPAGWLGAIRFRLERSLLAVLFIYLEFGGCVDDDLYFIPDHGRQILQTDHHDVVHIECLSEERILSVVTHMAAAEYELPNELPDPTFKRPYWMESNEADLQDE